MHLLAFIFPLEVLLSPFPDATHFLDSFPWLEFQSFTGNENFLFLVDYKWDHHLLGVGSGSSVHYCGSLLPEMNYLVLQFQPLF